MAPKLNRKRALIVLSKIDEIWRGEELWPGADVRFVDLGRYLCEFVQGSTGGWIT